jgi:hypothetical protein
MRKATIAGIICVAFVSGAFFGPKISLILEAKAAQPGTFQGYLDEGYEVKVAFSASPDDHVVYLQKGNSVIGCYQHIAYMNRDRECGVEH